MIRHRPAAPRSCAELPAPAKSNHTPYLPALPVAGFARIEFLPRLLFAQVKLACIFAGSANSWGSRYSFGIHQLTLSCNSAASTFFNKHFSVDQHRTLVARALQTGSYTRVEPKSSRAIPHKRTIRYGIPLGLIDRPVEIRGRLRSTRRFG